MKRGVRLSRTARNLFKAMLAEGAEKLGVDVADESYLAGSTRPGV
jgi:hypothetical protein